MIFDSFDNMARYAHVDPDIEEGFAYFKTADLDALPIGRIKIEGSQIACLSQEYESKADSACTWESHYRYIDIQCVTKGSERVEICHTDLLQRGTYEEELDKARYTGGHGDFITLRPGYFVVFYPGDAHRSCILADRPEMVRKFCLKIPVK